MLLLLWLAAAALAAAGCGDEGSEAGSRERPYHEFRSRPDLKVPRLLVTRPAEGTEPGYLFLAPKKEGRPSGPMIVDETGRVVWFHPVEPKEATDFRVQRYHGKPVLTWWEGTQPTVGIGQGIFVIVDSRYRRIAEVHAGGGLQGDSHEFLITPRGTALLAAYDPVRYDLSSLGGPKKGYVWDSVVQEVDIATGRLLFEWRSLDHVGVGESAQRLPARTASAAQPFDYFHVNSVKPDADGNLLVSARNTSAVYKIDRASGEILWRLGGRRSDFELGEGARFAWQHDARRQEDGTVSIFDNSAIPKVAEQSRALFLRLDRRPRRASLVRAYVHPRHLLSPHQGNVQRLSGGHVLVGWGGQPYVTEFTADGRVVFDAHLAVGDSYRAYRFPWKGRPTDRPAVAVRRGSDGTVTVYASWNGATDVAAWEVLAGADLLPVARVASSGFETAVKVRTKSRYVAARALDEFGSELAVSATVDLSP